MSSNCNHFNSENLLKAKAYECEECIKTGDRLVHLRTCQECGATLCCDNSPNKHATKHFHKLVLVKTGIRASGSNFRRAGRKTGHGVIMMKSLWNIEYFFNLLEL